MKETALAGMDDCITLEAVLLCLYPDLVQNLIHARSITMLCKPKDQPNLAGRMAIITVRLHANTHGRTELPAPRHSTLLP